MNTVYEIPNLYDGLKYIIPWVNTPRELLITLLNYFFMKQSVRNWGNILSMSVCALHKDNMIMGSMLDQRKESLWH